MSDKKISQLLSGGASQAADEYPIARSGANFKVTGANIAAAATSVGTLSSLTVSGNSYLATTSGNAGVGTTSPVTLKSKKTLQVYGYAKLGDDNGNGLLSLGDIASTNANVGIWRGAAGAFGSTGNYLSMGGYDGITFTTGNADISAQTERMRIDASGNLAVDTNTLYVDAANNRVGVGTATPDVTLDVEAAVGTSTSLAMLKNTSAANASNIAQMQFWVGNSFGGLEQIASIHGINPNAGANNGGTLVFSTSSNGTATTPTERMRLDASGNLGLGVTPSAWTVFKVFQSQRSAFSSYSDGSPNAATVISTNAFYNGNWKYLESIGAASYEQATSPSAAHKWFVAPSGTAGNTITFTQAMTLDASGNLGIGTASPTISAAATGIDLYDATDVQFRLHTGVSGTGLSDGFVLSMASDNTVYLYGYENAPMIFATNNTERARITAGGYFKASTNATYGNGNYAEFNQSANDERGLVVFSRAGTPLGLLVNYTAAAPNNTASPFFEASDTGATRAAIRSNGGLANYQSNNVDLSDARTKTDIAPVASMWDKIGALEIVTYKYVDQTHDDVNLGVIAQQVETVEPVWVDSDGFGDTPDGEEPFKTVYTKDITFAAIKALQEAMARIEALEARLEALEA